MDDKTYVKIPGVKRLLSSETFDDEDPSRSWWPEGQLTVCCVLWPYSTVESHEEFFKGFSSTLPSGTQFIGCKRDDVGVGQNYYMAVLGFPYRIGSWKGLKNRLSLKGSDGQTGVEKVIVYVVGSVCDNPCYCAGRCVKFWSTFCRVQGSESKKGCSSPAAFEVERDMELRPFVESVEDMWNKTE